MSKQATHEIKKKTIVMFLILISLHFIWAQETLIESYGNNCSVGWIQNGSYCYLFYNTSDMELKKNWYGSFLSCQNYGGSLLTIADEAENAFIEEQLKKDVTNQFWIGLNISSVIKFAWSDNTTLNFTAWHTSEPNNYRYNNEACVEIRENSWNDSPCDSPFGYICKYKIENASDNCIYNSSQNGNYCYLFNDNTKKNWYNSLLSCRKMGDLLIVTDQQEHSYIVNQLRLIKASKEARGINDTLHYWIGLNKYPMLRKFTWCDNTNTNFTNWDHGEPDNANYNNEACVKATYNGWSDSVCQEKLNFICKAKIVSWSEWSEWSTSNQYCIKTRTRSCNSNQWLSCSGSSVMMSSDILCKELSTTPFLLPTITAMTSMGFISNILLPSPSLINSVVFTPLYSPKYFFSSIIMEEFSTTNPFLMLTNTSKNSLKFTLTTLFPSSSLEHSVVSASPYLLTDDIHNIIADEKWAIWSECSVTCGLGIRRRYSLIKETAYLSQVENCNPINCSVDGMWGMWEEAQCSKTCGGGIKKIYRSCNSPHPSLYGLHCIGISTYTDFCDSDTVCPVNGYWSSWSSWSLCNKLCEGGTRSRFRSCSNPIPKICGQDCNENNLEFIDCPKSNCKNVAINLALFFLDEEFIEPYSFAASDPFLELRNKINEAIANLYKSKKVFSKFHVVVHSMENPA